MLETLLSASLILGVFGLGARFLIPLLGMHLSSSSGAELEQRCALALEDLRRDLAPSSPAGLSLVQSDAEFLLGIHQADNVAQDGTLVWCDSLVIYHWTSLDGRWKRLLWKDPTRAVLRAAAPTRLDDSALRQAAASGLLTNESAGWSSVKAEGAGGSPALPLVLRVVVTTPAGASRELVRTLGGRLPTL